MAKRPEAAYASDSVANVVAVLNSIAKPKSVAAITEETGLGYDAVRRILITLKLHGWAMQDPFKKWRYGRSFIAVANNALTS